MGVEGLGEDQEGITPCDCNSDNPDCINDNIFSCRSTDHLCRITLPDEKNRGGVSPSVDSNLSDFRCAVSRYEALLCGGKKCTPGDVKDYKDLGGDQCWDDKGDPSNQLGELKGFYDRELHRDAQNTSVNIKAAAADIKAKSKTITDTSAKNYSICLLNRMVETVETAIPADNTVSRSIYISHLTEAIKNLSQ